MTAPKVPAWKRPMPPVSECCIEWIKAKEADLAGE